MLMRINCSFKLSIMRSNKVELYLFSKILCMTRHQCKWCALLFKCTTQQIDFQTSFPISIIFECRLLWWRLVNQSQWLQKVICKIFEYKRKKSLVWQLFWSVLESWETKILCTLIKDESFYCPQHQSYD